MAAADPACPLCRAGRARCVFIKQGIQYWACGACRFRFSTPECNANLANTIDDYEDAYLQYLAPDPGDEANFESLCRWIQAVAPLDGNLLDVGAGSGKFVRFLRARGVSAVGIEPSRPLFDRFLAGDEAFSADTIEAVAARGRRFSVVTAFDVIEHVPDPAAFLRAVSEVLDEGGAFFLSTPDVDSWPARLFGRHWHFYYRYHVSFFGPRTIAAAANAAGLHLKDCRHRGRRRSVGYIVRYAAEFIGGKNAPRWARSFDAWNLPVNLFDTMYAAFRRDAI